ncbi:hypothetical protein NPIL_260171 [Nephila pilipes]|uniref:Uncharacterized protein n=1 Tax=Nephila pilipes TaxID=299642 RepID=A0A8X6KFK6_NEPPI|nr:hypothetical protein NPIL_260171 [Nephila pilipes]
MILFGQKRDFYSISDQNEKRNISCPELCSRRGANHIGNCNCREHIFQLKKTADSASNIEKRDVSCRELCNRTGANRIGNCYCHSNLFQQ